ncbi:MAG: tetratricopeptide repeat protein, partial [Candidatus Eiseniibacteriota bacterium]
AYMSPEQVRGETVDRRTDIWSFGVVLHEMLTGQVPFKGDYGEAILYSILNETPQPITSLRSSVPMDLERVVVKALAKRRDERYQHAEEILADLRRLRREGEAALPQGAPTPAGAERARRGFRRVVLPAGIAVVLAVSFLLLRPLLFQQVLVSEPKPIAVISFTNKTGDEAYDYLQEAIPDLLITSLEQSRYLRVTTRERMRDLLRQMGRDDVEAIDEELGFELCRMDGIDAVVLGSFTKAGYMFATDVKVLDVGTKRLLASSSSRERGVESILEKQIDKLSQDISRGLGLSERGADATQVRIAQVTTTSMDAYNYFLRGREEYERYYFQDAVRFLQRAIELDSTFAAAYLYLGRAYNGLFDNRARDDAYRKAKALSNKVTEKERLYIEAQYALTIENESEKQYRILKDIVQKYPREKLAHLYLAIHYRDRGQSELAIEESNRALELDPYYGLALNALAYEYIKTGDFGKAMSYFERYASVSPGDANPFDSMGELYLRMGRLDEAFSKYEEAIEVKSDFYGSYWSLSYIHALKEDYSEALRWLDEATAGKPPVGAIAMRLGFRGFYQGWLGDSGGALRSISELERLAAEVESSGWKGIADWMRVHVHMERGEFELCRKHLRRWYDWDVTEHPEEEAQLSARYNFFLGLTDVRQGRYDSARAKLAEMRSLLPRIDPAVAEREVCYYDLLHAEILLAEGSHQQAAEAFGDDWPLAGTLNYRLMAPYNVPFVKDVRARAYLAQGKLDEAVAEYERLTTFRAGSGDLRLIHPMYHYRLAKLYEEKGWFRKAAERYEKFLEIWKHADADRPEVQDARSKLRALTGSSG